jgi:hypothetical protein
MRQKYPCCIIGVLRQRYGIVTNPYKNNKELVASGGAKRGSRCHARFNGSTCGSNLKQIIVIFTEEIHCYTTLKVETGVCRGVFLMIDYKLRRVRIYPYF